MKEMKNPAIVMIDVFSILAISVFVLHIVSAGMSSSRERPNVCIVNVRLAPAIDDSKREELPAHLSEMVQFSIEGAASSGNSRAFLSLTTHGFQLILENPTMQSIRMVIDKIIDPRILGLDIEGEAETVGVGTREIGGQVGQWDDPEIFDGCDRP